MDVARGMDFTSSDKTCKAKKRETKDEAGTCIKLPNPRRKRRRIEKETLEEHVHEESKIQTGTGACRQ